MDKYGKFHKFLKADFAGEEEWLNLQAKEGLHLLDTNGSDYEFKKGNKGAWIYRTDDIKKEDDPETYLDKYTPAGWKYVCRTEDRAYFRMSKTAKGADDSMFTPKEERLAFAKKQLLHKLYKWIPLCILGAIYIIVALFTGVFAGFPKAAKVALQLLAFVVLMLIATVIGVYGNELRWCKGIAVTKEKTEEKKEMSLQEALKNMED